MIPCLLKRAFGKLAEEPLNQALRTVPTWQYDAARPSINKTFTFNDFNAAWEFMCLCARKIGQVDHHPEWFNVYARVEVTLTTHDDSGVTEKDIWLAGFMDRAEELIKFDKQSE